LARQIPIAPPMAIAATISANPLRPAPSVCTAPLLTHTTIEIGHDSDSAEFDGIKATGRPLERILAVVNPLRERAGVGSGFKMISKNNFQSNIGLGASASGFAALAMATKKALGLELSIEELSTYARRGAGSASTPFPAASARATLLPAFGPVKRSGHATNVHCTSRRAASC
jgi:mevalonate pyrophosphate decarboxylase